MEKAAETNTPNEETRFFGRIGRGLFRARRARGRWVYLAWFICYVVFAFATDRDVFGPANPSVAEFTFWCLPPLIAYIQFRAPTVAGWILIAVPTLIAAVYFGLIGAFGILYSLHDSNFHDRGVIDALLIGLSLAALEFLAFGLVYYRPFGSDKQANKPRLAPDVSIGGETERSQP